MAAFNSTFQTDLAKPSRVVPIPDTYTRGDNESHTITVLVYDSANPSCGLMAGSVSAAVARQDGNTIPLTTGTKGAATVPVKLADGSTAQATPCTVTLKQACFDCPGQVVVVIRLVSGETITSIFVGSGKVNAGLTNSIIDPGDVITDITALIAAAEQAAEDAEEALAIATHVVRYDETQTMTSSERAIASHNVGAHKIAEVFDPTATYTQGRYVLYLGDLYRLDAASFGPGAFNYSTGGWTYINPTQEPISLAEHSYTDAEKAQARENIGAGSAEDVSDLQMTDLQLGGMISDVGHSLAAEYDWQAGTYAVGDYVMSGDKLYRCTTAIATPETWTPAHWTEVKLSGDLTDLRGAITQGTKNLLQLTPKSETSKGLTFNISVRNIISISGTSTASNADTTISLSSNAHLESGKQYVLSVNNYTASSTLYVYLLVNGSAVNTLYIVDTVPFAQFTANADVDIDSIIVRYPSSGTVINQTFGIQLEESIAASPFVPGTSADDVHISDYLKEKFYRFDPVFANGYFDDNGYPATETNSSFNSYIITPDLMFVKAGSMISPNHYPDGMYVAIREYNSNGNHIQSIFGGNLFGTYTFDHDCYIRITMRNTDYADIIPSRANEIYTFYFYGNGETENKTKISFIGLGTGENLSGQSILIRFPSGKNMLIDSHLLSYYSGFRNLLKAHGVRRIDYYVQSHYHADHCGLLNILTYNPDWVDIEDSTVFLPQLITEENLANVSENAQTLIDRQDAMVSLFEQENCTIIRPTTGQVNEIEGIKFAWYNTDHSVYAPNGTHPSTNYNDWSLCVNIIDGWNIVNFSADIGPIGQGVVGGTLPKADILTAPHHGWDNGANNLIPAYINNVSPTVVISTNGWEHNPENTDSPANINLATSAMQSYCEANAVPNYPTFSNGTIEIVMDNNKWAFDGHYTRYIRNGKNWKFNDNTDKEE